MGKKSKTFSGKAGWEHDKGGKQTDESRTGVIYWKSHLTQKKKKKKARPFLT